jgi:hypothetical protein
VARWNAHGIAGLVGVALVLAVLMVPRVLDLAARRHRGRQVRRAAAAGAALRLSWRAAGLVVQGFFLGNMLPMTAVVGQLYIDAPLRLCNAYLLDDQARLGQWLIALAVLLALGWLAQVGWWMARREGAPHRWRRTIPEKCSLFDSYQRFIDKRCRPILLKPIRPEQSLPNPPGAAPGGCPPACSAPSRPPVRWWARAAAAAWRCARSRPSARP